ncbi:MAG: hypothetical protein KF708_23310 [Pirellulales bacterium]|nr:hypothetical protein [Pirellulales bacterium]
MSRRKRAFVVVATLALVVCAAALGSLWAVRHEPTFYREALDRSQVEQRRASDELLENASALASRARLSGDWRALFTAQQINGWLACDVPHNHPDLLPPEISQPCVAIDDHHVRFACRYETGGVNLVLSLEVEVHLTAPNEFSVRFHRARAGAIPLPLASLLDHLTDRARSMDLHVRWLQSRGDPVAVISVPPPRTDDATRLSIESLRLAGGELYVAGHTNSGDNYEPQQPAPSPAVAGEPSANEKLKR